MLIPNENFWTPKKLAVEFGVSYSTVLNWINDGELRTIRFGRMYRIYESFWQEFLETCTTGKVCM
jgi:excisionase family DNA binding protein